MVLGVLANQAAREPLEKKLGQSSTRARDRSTRA
ncbi:hypothetical protein OROGR_023713 [Orobanche gracilis]